MTRESLDTRRRCLRYQLDGVEQTFDLPLGEIRIGSSRRSDLRLSTPGVSREHAVLTMTQDAVWVSDRGSKNGTFVNDQRIERAGLQPGSVLTLGSVDLLFEDLDSEDRTLALLLDDAPRTRNPATAGLETFSTLSQALPPPRPPSASKLAIPEDYLCGTSPPVLALYGQMEAVLEGDLPLLLLGETGVGKERLVQILHDSSSRREGPLVAINCAAVPAELLEAELFGIGKGVASGVAPRPGQFQLAAGGTLFLDEIGDMPLALQAKLLRVLQEKQIQPLGAPAQRLDARIVAATHSDLPQRMEAGQFRPDLYFRLAGSTLRIPPLRECPEDILRLTEHFLRRAAEQTGRRVRGVTVKALRVLRNHPWPGNVRELEHEIHRAVLLLKDGGIVDTSKLSPHLLEAEEARPPAAETTDSSFESLDLESRVEALERQLIQKALHRAQGRQVHAAELLGISRYNLARKLKHLDIDYRAFRGEAPTDDEP